jgi:hypothetical protein
LDELSASGDGDLSVNEQRLFPDPTAAVDFVRTVLDSASRYFDRNLAVWEVFSVPLGGGQGVS